MSDQDLLKEAKKLFKRCQTWEQTARSNFDNDLRFAEGDSYNMYQWPTTIINDRTSSDRPCLTTNIVRQHNLQIINDALANKPGIKFRAVSDGASKQSAGIWDDIARRIEYESNFGAVLDHVTGYQVKAGIGYFRVMTEYADAQSFDQVIRLVPIADPRMVYLDPDCVQLDKSDAKYGFIFSDVPKDDFARKYPQYVNEVGSNTFLGEEYNWVQKDYIRIAEYFYTEYRKDQLLLLVDEETGQEVTVLRSQIGQGAFRLLKADSANKVRPVEVPQIKYCKIVGNHICEKQDWPGKYIPIVAVIGEETNIDGILDRKGHTRAMLDPQRMYNYWNSAAVEFVALQSKTPWVAAAESVEQHQELWDRANVENASVLLYTAKAEDGSDIPPPRRIEPPVQSQGYVQGAQIARTEMMMASGQYQNQMGEPGNERTGKAISERQRQGDKATYHFINNLARAVRYTGIILYDLVPHIYDTKRVMQLLGEDGVEYSVTLDPNAKKAFEERTARVTQEVEKIFNPTIGKYTVYADVGPGYATRREEAWNAFNNILTQAPNLVPIIGDLLLLAGDFPNAEVAAERLRRMVPPAALGTGPTPQEQQLQAQLQAQQQTLGALTEENATLRIAQKGKEEANNINDYKSQTDRLKVIAEQGIVNPIVFEGMLVQLIQDSVNTAMREKQLFDDQQRVLPPAPGQNTADLAVSASQPGQMNPLMAAALKGPPPAGISAQPHQPMPAPGAMPPAGRPPMMPQPGALQ